MAFKKPSKSAFMSNVMTASSKGSTQKREILSLMADEIIEAYKNMGTSTGIAQTLNEQFEDQMKEETTHYPDKATGKIKSRTGKPIFTQANIRKFLIDKNIIRLDKVPKKESGLQKDTYIDTIIEG